jgi:Zinc carboxypeptidase
MHSLASLLFVGFCFVGLPGQQSAWFPGSTYDPGIPTPKSVLGYEIGEYYTEHPQMTAYMRRLEAASNRVKVFSVGESAERRELILVAVSDPENIQRIDEIRAMIEELRDPRKTSEVRAREIVRSTPAVAWMNFANDGNESAALEAAIQLAYQLAAGQDADTLKILKEVVTVIYPLHNPDAHARHVTWMKASAMRNPDPAAQEHRGDWRMDTNNTHYQIDPNRDAAFLSQVESQVIVREIHRWNPVVFVDHHGNPDRFFFPPWALPVNPQLDENARQWVDVYGKNIAAAFDKNGWIYFTRQVFDLHYPGYYDSYPTLNGATGMTFETDGGGNKGLAYALPDGRVTTLRDGALHHFTGSMASLSTTAQNREGRLIDLYRFRARAMSEAASEPVKEYVLLPGNDPTRTADLIDLLLQHKIEVHQARTSFASATAHDYFSNQAQKKTFPSGAYLVFTAQPQKRLLRTLLDRDTPLEKDFVDQVMKAKAYNDQVGESAPKKPYGFYDINAWSLPLAYGVEAYWTEERFDGKADLVTARPKAQLAPPEKARMAYLFPWNSKGATRVAGALWQENYRIALAREEFTIGGKSFPKGTTVVMTKSNPESLHARLAELAAANEVDVYAAETAFADKGKDLGDRSVMDLEKPSIAVVCERPASQTVYGAIWFMLENMYGIPFTAIKGEDLNSADLSRYNVIVLPDGPASSYQRLFDEKVTDRLKNWVREGGRLVCVKGAAQWASSDKVALTTAHDKFAQVAAKAKGEEKQEKRKRMDVVSGAFVRLDVDSDHYLGTGIENSIVALFRSNVVFSPSEKGANVAKIAAEAPILAGFVFEEARAALPGGAFLWDEPNGRGNVICFADDVTFRTFLHGAHRLFLNSLLILPRRGTVQPWFDQDGR